jgi:hypothetical protein
VKVKPWKSACLLATLGLCAAFVIAPPDAACQSPADDSGSSAAKTSPAAEKVKLNDVTRVSTAAMAHQAAKEKAKEEKPSTEKPKDESKPEEASASPVSEFHPAAKSKDDGKDSGQVLSENGGSRRLDKVHGSVQGATGSGTRAGGAEVGAGSKSGKTHVYVETERSRTDTPIPH